MNFLSSDVRAAREQMNIGGVTYPTLPLQDPAARPTSMYSQQSSACSPTASYTAGPYNVPGMSPQPHSAYYSGMVGPQHPFYNRVSDTQQSVSLYRFCFSCGSSDEDWSRRMVTFLLFLQFCFVVL